LFELGESGEMRSRCLSRIAMLEFKAREDQKAKR
jgi:hypothetical protein